MTRYRVCSLLLFTVAASEALNAADFFTVCHTKDPKFEECIRKTLEDLRPLLKKGSKELKIPSIEPMVVPKAKVDQKTGAVNVDSTFTNVKVTGITNYKITKVRADLDKGLLEIGAEMPYLYVDSNYSIKGKILVLPITGDGDSHTNYTGVSGIMTMNLKPVMRDGVKYMNLEKISFDAGVKKADVHMNNLFNGNKELGDAMNKFISENWEVVYQEFKPVSDAVIASIFESIATKIFQKFPANEILPD